MFGVGHAKPKMTDKTELVQWFRQDWHKPHGNEDWVSGNYHYHWKVKK